MHELALMESVVAAVEEKVPDGTITLLRLEVGRLSAVVPDALRFCFELCVRGTRLEGATLDIIDVAGVARCRGCLTELRGIEAWAVCHCGSADLEILAGTELRVKNVEVI